MTLDDLLSGASLVASIVAVALGLRRHNSKAHEAKMTARREQGLAYARAAWDVVQARKTAPGAMRAALLDAFRLADTALDGKRDFTDAQAASFIDETRPK